MFDARTNKSVISVEHGQPVESVLLFPSGGLLVSAGILKIAFTYIVGFESVMSLSVTFYNLILCTWITYLGFAQLINRTSKQLLFIDYLMWARYWALIYKLLSLEVSEFSPYFATKEINKSF